MLGNEPPADLFTSVDVNRDRVISLDEWHWSRASFDRARCESRRPVDACRSSSGTAAACRARKRRLAAGYERGQIEGRQAGREERLNNRPWDLEGQSELETADSGYQPGMGPKAEYQAGYREGFRRAYREGWNRRSRPN